MTVLSSLAKAFERLHDRPPLGYSTQNIGFLISLNEDGSPAGDPISLLEGEGKHAKPLPMPVPQPVKRTQGIVPNLLWDKTSYVLGVTTGGGKRTAEEHAAFVTKHLNAIGKSDDAGLNALALFLRDWHPEKFNAKSWPKEMKDQNIVFALESDRINNVYLHDRAAAKSLLERLTVSEHATTRICLVTGKAAPIARLHPSIKGVWRAQSSGAALVSFNLDAFTSYGHEQGDNAPVSEGAAFAYSATLNRFLARSSGHRFQVADASTVFWADAENIAEAEKAEKIFDFLFDANKVEDGDANHTLLAREAFKKLEGIRNGLPLADVEPQLDPGIQFYILGLASNAARLAVRFYYSTDFVTLVENYQRFASDIRIEPPPRNGYPRLWRYLQETAADGAKINILPNLASELMRSILYGTQYPPTLMSSVQTRIRTDGEINALRAGMLRALLVRNYNRKVSVALDPENRNRGYLLGRLFGIYQQIEMVAVGSKVKANLRDKYYSLACAQPRKIFSFLERASSIHLTAISKKTPGYRVVLDKALESVAGVMGAECDRFASSLSGQDQAFFGLGYYHQRNEFFKKADQIVVTEIDR